MEMPDFIRFASDATLAALWGGAFLLLAVTALLAERLRARRRKIDAVGWVPWTALFLVGALCAVALLTLAVRGWLTG